MTFRLHALLAPLLALLLLSGCSIELQHGLTEPDANEIYVLLNKNGISAAKQKETGDTATFTIIVPKADAAQAAELLKTNSLPRPMEKGLNHFAKGGMVPTATEERAMMLKAMAGEVSNALNQIDGILEARVIVMVPETSDLTQPENKPMPSSSVLVKFRPSEDGSPPISAEAVKQFVATAVPEMKPSSVTVVMTQAQLPSAEVNAENRLQDVLGLRMTVSSASTFRVMVAVTALLILAMLGLSAWTFMRGGSEGAAARPRGR